MRFWKSTPSYETLLKAFPWNKVCHIQVGIPFLDRMHLNLQQRARAIIERRPDLERLFDD